MKSPSQNKLRLSRRISYHACETIHSPLIKGMTGDWETLQAFPAWGRGTASAALGCFRMQHKCASLSPILPAVFHAIVTLSAPAGHLPLEGKATIREYHPLNRRPTTLVNLSAPQVPSSRAQPRDLYCTAAICTHAPSLKRHLGASFFAFPSLTIYRSARRIPPLQSG